MRNLPKYRIRANTFAILGAVFALAAVSSPLRSAEDSGYWRQIQEENVEKIKEVPDLTPYGERVRVTLLGPKSVDKLEFNVPPEYITRLSGSEGDGFEILSISIVLPTLEPNTWKHVKKLRREQAVLPKYYTDVRNHIFVSINRHKSHKNSGGSIQARLDATFERSPTEVHGLIYYPRRLCEDSSESADSELAREILSPTPRTCPSGSDEYFFSLSGPNGRWYKISCSRKAVSEESSGCILRTTFRGRGLTYVFRRSQLEFWRAIDRAVRLLLEEFEVNPSATPS